MKPPRHQIKLNVIRFTLIAVGIALVAYLAGRFQTSRQMQPYVSFGPLGP